MPNPPTRFYRPESVSALRNAMGRLGAERIFVKRLKPNDNSKQQIYLGRDFSAIPPLPRAAIESFSGSSKKPRAGGKPIFRTKLKWYWLDRDGNPQLAPRTQLIFYPQFPEVRLSGFLQGSSASPSSLMQYRERLEGRYLLMGIGKSNAVYAVVLHPDSAAARELGKLDLPKFNELFLELRPDTLIRGDSRILLLNRLREINAKLWIPAKRLRTDGSVIDPYLSMNSGGYTLEAEFDVIPNGNAEPDYLGWELKQFRVPKCGKTDSARLTLMTPEPDGGFYHEKGAEAFVRKYGYYSGKIPDRLDFTGIHRVGSECKRTRMKLILEGVDLTSGEIVSANGGVILLRTGESNAAAKWSFAKLLDHWQRKHQRAAYVPSLTQSEPKAHSYCPVVKLAEGTAFDRLLKVLARGTAYYDPALKTEKSSSKGPTKRRSQFRIVSRHIDDLYDKSEFVDVRTTKI